MSLTFDCGCCCNAARRKGKGAGNPGKPGKRLRLEDLQSQFGVGLKEAANRLGICPTTLKVHPRAMTNPPLTQAPCAKMAALSPAAQQDWNNVYSFSACVSNY